MSLITLDDGTTIAIDVDENLDIKNGDVITKWNDIPINAAIDSVIIPIHESLIEHEKITKTFYLASVGDDNVSITYINSNNEEKTTTLNKLDSNLPRAIKSINTFNHDEEEEYISKMLNNNIGYLKIPSEETNPFNDSLAYITDNHKKAREMYAFLLKNFLN